MLLATPTFTRTLRILTVIPIHTSITHSTVVQTPTASSARITADYDASLIQHCQRRVHVNNYVLYIYMQVYTNSNRDIHVCNGACVKSGACHVSCGFTLVASVIYQLVIRTQHAVIYARTTYTTVHGMTKSRRQ